MNIKNTALAAMLAGCMLSGSAFAQTEARNELGGQLLIGSTKVAGTSSDTGFGNIYYGRFVTDSLEVLGNVSYQATSSGGFESTTLGLSAGVLYYFLPVGKKGNVAPYVGGDLAFSTTDTTGAGFSSTTDSGGWDVKLGVKVFITDNAALNIEYMHQEMEDDSFIPVETENDFVTIGVSTLF